MAKTYQQHRKAVTARYRERRRYLWQRLTSVQQRIHALNRMILRIQNTRQARVPAHALRRGLSGSYIDYLRRRRAQLYVQEHEISHDYHDLRDQEQDELDDWQQDD